MLYRRITAAFLPDLMQKSPRGNPTMDLALLGRQFYEKKNFDERVDGIQDKLSKWAFKDLSLFGRIQTIKRFAVSKIVLSASIQCNLEHIVVRRNTP